MAQPTLIIGSYLSPYVRKVLVALELKGVAYEVDPIVPFFGDHRFAQISPLRRIPVLIDDEVTLCDSSVICQYLDEKYPSPPLYPTARFARAKARWLEEYADSRLGDVFIWRLYNEIVISRFVWGKPTSKEVVERTRNVELPEVLDHLEPQLPAAGYFYEALSIADISIASFFRNLDFARIEIDAERWPRTVAYVERIHKTPPFQVLRFFEDLCMKTPIAQHREALREAGAPISVESYGTSAPRPGPMTIGF
jgi:glutathione S-transferase